MKQVLIFSGTTEGRELAEILAKAGIRCTVCVATEYGEMVMPPFPGVTIHQGRMKTEEMRAFMQQEEFLAVTDATHPFATEVSKNIRESLKNLKIPYLRLKRETGNLREHADEKECGPVWFATTQDCAKALEKTEGNILLTTGSKELSTFCANDAVKKRLYVRVLPGIESLELCQKQEIPGGQVLALQGPFSEELNIALIRQYQIRCIVTKESGRNGGFEEKVSAAERTHTACYVIGNPERETGMTFSQVCRRLEELTGKQLIQNGGLRISLVGVGMGDLQTLTVAAKRQIDMADYLLGAKRLLAEFSGKYDTLPFYRATDIIPFLEKLERQEASADARKVVILFSGDSGFYSGCTKLYQELLKWKKQWEEQDSMGKGQKIDLRIFPGISSVSFLAAAVGISWQDAIIMSIHGRAETSEWRAELLENVKYHDKTFVLLSGVRDLQMLGQVLSTAGPTGCKILVGYQLSYENQEIRELTPTECIHATKEGLYLCLVQNPSVPKKLLTHGKGDALFERDKVPMTKEEIREISICKLRLRQDAAVYDIGSGTGSIAVEIAAVSADISVYAIEKKAQAAELIRKNCTRFQTVNVKVIEGEAPEALTALPKPTHAFIGGSGGNLKDILQKLYEKNPGMRVVINAVSLETICEVREVLHEFSICDAEIVQVQVSRSEKIGNYHLMKAENPVFICSFDFNGNR